MNNSPLTATDLSREADRLGLVIDSQRLDASHALTPSLLEFVTQLGKYLDSGAEARVPIDQRRTPPMRRVVARVTSTASKDDLRELGRMYANRLASLAAAQSPRQSTLPRIRVMLARVASLLYLVDDDAMRSVAR